MIPLNFYQNNKQINCPIKSSVGCHVFAGGSLSSLDSGAGSSLLWPGSSLAQLGMVPALRPLPSLSELTCTAEAHALGDGPRLWSGLWPDKAGFPLIFPGDPGGPVKPGWAADELGIWGHDPMAFGTGLQGNCGPMPMPGAAG